jgi:hypothetical protein
VVTLLAVYFIAGVSAHDERLITISFIVGVVVGQLWPRLWRWADRRQRPRR